MFQTIKLTWVLLVLLSTIIFSGCISERQHKVLSYPSWYTKSYQDTDIMLYATAESDSEKEATTLALNTIASKISVSIESSYSSTTNSSFDAYSKSTQQNIKHSVKKIDFTSYKVLNKEKISNGNFVVLVQVNKNILARSLQFKIENDIKQYQMILSDRYSNIISKLKRYKNIRQNIINTQSSIYILQSLDNVSETKKYLSQINRLTNKIDSFTNGIKFKLTENQFGKDFTEVLSSLITKKGFTIVNSKPDINLNLTVSKTKINSLGYKILKVTIDIEAKDKKRVIGREKIVVGGKSIANFEQANSFALKNFNDKMLNEDILKKLLGI